MRRKPGSLMEKEILHIHGTILKGIDDANAGRYRNKAVRISGSSVVLPHPLRVPEMMAEFADWLENARNIHPVNLAAEAHYRLVSIHPFYRWQWPDCPTADEHDPFNDRLSASDYPQA